MAHAPQKIQYAFKGRSANIHDTYNVDPPSILQPEWLYRDGDISIDASNVDQ